MLEIRRAKEVRGSVDLPPSPDLFLLSAVVTLAAQTRSVVSPRIDTPLVNRYKDAFAGHLTFDSGDQGVSVASAAAETPASIALDIGMLPYRDFIAFALLGMGKALACPSISDQRITAWEETARTMGCTLATQRGESTTTVRLEKSDTFGPPLQDVSADAVYPLLGMALGLRRRVSFTMDAVFSSPVRHVLAAFGFELHVKSTDQTDPTDPVAKRMRFLQKKKRAEETHAFRVSADFSVKARDDVAIDLPGDEVLASLFVLAKSLIQKGALVVNNASLEPWAVQMLDFVRKMGCKPALQPTRETSFGSCGLMQLQSFELTSRKTNCRPVCLFADHLAAELICAAFATGQSVFRGLEDLRADQPDTLDRLHACLEKMGIRHGEMPDGMVVDGGRELDGFDYIEDISAPINGALAIAGLKCRGKSTIADAAITDRWPDFRQMISSVCEFRAQA